MNNRPDQFTDVLETWLGEGGHEEDPHRILDRALSRVDATRQSRFSWLPGALVMTDGALRFAVAAATVTVVVVVGLALVTTGTSPGGPGPVASSPSSASPSPVAPTNIVGLPPVGAIPSDSTPGELVIRFGSSLGQQITGWVYADGRIIWSQFLSTPAGAGDDFTGMVEQRLTADGVRFLTEQLTASGLFESDLDLHRSINGCVEFRLLSGPTPVNVAMCGGEPMGRPEATAEQEAALLALNALFQDSSSWPASAWEDDSISAYVPSEYAVCFGIRAPNSAPGYWTGPVDPELVWAVLPVASQDILRAGEPTTNSGWMHADGGCSVLSTDDARALARTFETSGIIHRSEPISTHFVAYVFLHPSPEWDQFWIQFGPIHPDGTPVWNGPG